MTEVNIHYPTDSSLLGDGIRVLSRGLARIAAQCKTGAVRVVNHARAVTRAGLDAAAGAGIGQGDSALAQRQAAVVGSWLAVETQITRLQYFQPLVRKVIQQTQQRVLGGNRHAPGKVLSLFEPHSQVIRKGKAHKPNEFGGLVRLDEVENGIVNGTC